MADGNKKHRIGLLLAGTAFTIMWFVYLQIHAGVGSNAFVTVGFDSAYNHMWNLWWVGHALFDLGQSPYRTDFNGYPEIISLTYHQVIFPLGVLSYPLFQLGLRAGQVLYLWTLILGAVGFIGMYFLVERLRGPPIGALVAGLYFIMNPIGWQNLVRPDSLSYVLFPWLILSVIWSQEGTRWRILVPSVLGAVIVLLSPYFAAGWMLLWLLVMPFSEQLGIKLTRVLPVAPLALLFSSFEWVPQATGSKPSLVEWRVVEAFSADLSAWVLPPPSFWWVPESLAFWSRTWQATEPSLYLGWIGIGVLVFGFRKIPERFQMWYLAVLVVFFLLASGPGLTIFGSTFGSGWLPYGWGMLTLDTIRALRAPLRFGFFVVFLVAIGLGYLFPKRTNVALLVGGLVLLELFRSPLPARPIPSAESIEVVEETVSEPALVPVPLTDYLTEVMYAQTIHEKKHAMHGLSYGNKTLWQRVSRNPVLNALYRREALPDEGWNQLMEDGFGGVIVHKQPMRGHSGLLQQWNDDLRQRWGPPVIDNRFIRVYRFSDNSNQTVIKRKN